MNHYPEAFRRPNDPDWPAEALWFAAKFYLLCMIVRALQ